MKNLQIPAVLLSVYLLVSLFIPYVFQGIEIMLVDAAAWGIAIVAVIFVMRRYQIRMVKGNPEIAFIAIAIGATQILLPVFAAFFVGFARNTVIWDLMTLAVYLPYVLAGLFAVELSRVTLAQSANRRRPTSMLLLASILCAVVSIPSYAGLTSLTEVLKFLLQTFIPGLAVSLLATCFAFYGGLLASLTYVAIPTLFTWFSPIIPNPPWAIESLVTVGLSTVGFIFLSQTADQRLAKHFSRKSRKQSSLLPWVGITLLALVLVWGGSGLLGVTPTIIASGSMQPALRLGDIAILVPASPTSIRVGEIVQYQIPNMTIIHRVIDTYIAGGSMWIVTKGDANSAPDEPVSLGQVTGKVVFVIPQLGWVTIALRTFLTTAFNYMVNNLIVLPLVLVALIPPSALLIHKRYNQPVRKIRRRLSR